MKSFKYISQAKYDEDNKLLDHAIGNVLKQVKTDVGYISNAKGVAIVFLGKSCKYYKVI